VFGVDCQSGMSGGTVESGRHWSPPLDPELEAPHADAHDPSSQETTADAVASALGCSSSHDVAHVWSVQLPAQPKNATHSLSFAHAA
jgi:hypothetical protein